MSLRYVVNIKGLPEEYKQNYEKVKVSDVRSVESKFGDRQRSEGVVQEREERFVFMLLFRTILS